MSDRIALCFGYDEKTEKLDFRSFLCSVAAFNLPGSKEKKLKIAFRIQDFDGMEILYFFLFLLTSNYRN